MKKEKQIKTHQRRTKGGKTVIVRAHKAKYDAADELKKSLSKKKGAGDELASRKKQTPVETPDLGFTDAEFKEWYHWDQEGDPKNETALKVEKALIAKMGKRAYNRYFNEMSDNYSARGHSKAYKSLVAEHTETPTPKTPKMETTKSKKMSEGEKAAEYFYRGTTKRTGDGRNPDYSAENFERAGKNLGIPPMKLAKYLLDEDSDVGKKLKRIVGEKEYIEELSYGDVGLAIMNGEWKKSSKGGTATKGKSRDKAFVEGFLEGKPSTETLNPQPKERTSWGHTSREKGKAVRPLDMRGQANYDGIIASGIKLPKKFTYDSDTRSDYYDSFRTKDPTAMANVINQAKKAKWPSSGSGTSRMKRYTSPDGRVHILIDRSDKNKSVSIFYR